MTISVYYISKTSQITTPVKEEKKGRANMTKKGWIQLRKSMNESETRRKKNVYAELKCSALFIYESDQEQEDCQLIIPVHSFNVSIYSTNDNDTFGRSTFLRLSAINDDQEYYLTCERALDKEDWYFGLLSAANVNELEPVEMMDSTHFDPMAMACLISTNERDADYRQVQWLNAIVGRTFLGMYKTKAMYELVQEKVAKKIKHTKLSSLLGEIHIQSIDIGHSAPFITQPKLLSLTPDGELSAEAMVDYNGAFKVVIQTDCSYSLIRVPLILSVTLKKLYGKFLFKVKPPPSNRYWIGFYELPRMEWEILPIVSDKQIHIKLSLVINAIEAKISEFIMENMVLPNMDDFPFYTAQGSGGIFGERVPRPSRVDPQEQALDKPVEMINKKPPQEQASEEIVLLLPKPPTRRSDSVDILESHTKNTYRVNSEPVIRNRKRNYSLPDAANTTQNLPVDDMMTSSTSTTISASSSLSELKVDRPVDESYAETIHPLENSELEKVYDSDIESKESIRSFKYNKNRLMSNMSSKKQVFYNMTGNLFSKKNKFIKPKITKELKEERDRELQEIHNRKMMGLFLTSPAGPEEASY